MLEEIAVELFPTGSYRFQGKVGLDEGAAGVAHCFAFLRGERLECEHCGGQGLWIAYGDEETGFVGDKSFAGAGCVGGDDGQSRGGSFQHGDGQAFPEGGEHEGVSGCEERLDVRLKAREVDALSDVEACGECAELEFGGAGAGDGEGGVVGELSEGAEEGWVVLDGGEAADGQPAEWRDEGWFGLG